MFVPYLIGKAKLTLMGFLALTEGVEFFHDEIGTAIGEKCDTNYIRVDYDHASWYNYSRTLLLS